MKRRFQSSIRGKLTIWLLAVFTLLSVLYTRAYHERYKEHLSSSLQSHRNVARLIANTLDSDIEWIVFSQISVGDFLVENKCTRWSAARYLRAICNARPYYISQSYLSSSGKTLASSDPRLYGASLGDFADVRPVFSGKSPILRGPAWSISGQRRCITISTAIREGGKVKGAIRSEMSPEAFGEPLLSLIGERADVVILNERGAEVYRGGSQSAHIPEQFLRRQPFVANSLKGRSATSQIFHSDSGEDYIGSAIPLRSGGWTLVAARPAGQTLAKARTDFAHGMYTTVGLAAALMSFFWWWCGLFFVGNLRRLSRGAAALAVGDFHKRIRIRSNDELGALAQAFNEMAESLEYHEKQVQDKSAALQSLLDVAQVVSSSLELPTVATAVCQAINRGFGASYVAVYVPDDTNDLQLLTFHSYTAHRRKKPPEDWMRIAVSAYKYRVQETVAENKDGTDEQVIDSENKVEPQTLIATPLVAGDRPAGVLVAGFAGADLGESGVLQNRTDLLNAFASHAAVAIRNAQTYANAEEYSKSLAAWLDELSALRYVTEEITSSLDLQEVLQTLGRLTCDVMKARACAIMLLNPDGNMAAAEATKLSPRMRKLCECRIGDPVSGLAAREKRPIAAKDLFIDYPDVEVAQRASEEGFHGFLSVPLISGRELLGTIDVYMADPHDFTAYEIDLLSSIAAHAAMAIRNAQLFGKEYRIAETLQNVILGSVPSETAGLRLGCKYVPALDEAQVGGDFHDVITLPGGKVGVVVADVSGKGLSAAMHTAMCKFMLRGYAFQWPDQPGRVLSMVNDALCCFGGSRFFVTVFYCVYDPTTGRLTYANAGHPPAIWALEEGLQQNLLYQTGVPVGMEEGQEYGERIVTLSPSDVLVMYTDGLMDARRGKQTLGIEGVQEIIFSIDTTRDPQVLVERLYTEALHYARNGLRDDMAIVALHVDRIEAASGIVQESHSPVEENPLAASG